MNDDKKAAAVIIAVGLAPSALAAVYYIKTVREERAKRKKIEAWERESLILIQDAHNRSIKKINDRDVPLGEALNYMVEQNRFVRQIINDQKPK